MMDILSIMSIYANVIYFYNLECYELCTECILYEKCTSCLNIAELIED